MRFQSNRSSCGPAALHNALSAIGITRTEDELIALTGQTPDGTSPRGLVKAIKAITSPEAPLLGTPFSTKDDEAAKVGLWWNVGNLGRPVILCVDQFEHWVVCVGYLGRRFQVVDSADNRLLISYSEGELLRRWSAPNGGFYGIIV